MSWIMTDDTSLSDILSADEWQTSHYFYFADPVRQAEFEREMIGPDFAMTSSAKSGNPQAGARPYLTILTRRESRHETEDQALTLMRHLAARAEAYGGLYDGSESALQVDDEEFAELEKFIATLPKPVTH